MLSELHIRDFALIDRLDLSFGAGLSILTGETGAGKSIVIDALGFVMGERASADLIHTGSLKTVVEAVFDLRDAPESSRRVLADTGVQNDDEPEVLLMSRELSRAGRSQCRINGALVPAATLRQVTENLVDIHGQHEHHSLLSQDSHVDLLDNWLGADILAVRRRVAEQYARVSRLQRQIDDLRSQARERTRNLDIFRYQQQEIGEADLKDDEEEELVTERTRLGNAESLAAVAEDAYARLSDGAVGQISSVLSTLQRSEHLDPGLGPIVEQLTEASAFAEEAARLLRSYRGTIEFNAERLEQIQDRIQLVHSLQRKYGETIAEVRAYSEELARKIDDLENSEIIEAELLSDLDGSQELLRANVSTLTKARTAGGRRFAKAILSELKDLGMGSTRFEVDLQEEPVGSRGAERVEFLLSANPGEPLKPLVRVASGGEASRIMLAIKSVLAQTAYVPTLVFDEIDVGVGGRTAKTIADKLTRLAEFAQILCITHLPQIASRPVSAHFLIEKSIKHGQTTVNVRSLPSSEREEEIARMLGGESETVLQHAREMLSRK